MSEDYKLLNKLEEINYKLGLIADALGRIAFALDKQAEEEDIMNRVMSMWIDKVKEMAGEQPESDEEEKA